MKIIEFKKYGPPEVLEMKESKKPVPGNNEILVKIKATSVNFGDIIVRNFKEISPRKFHMPFLFWLIGKIYFGFRKPKKKILGSEFSGEIESIGKDVKQFKQGDQVFGYSGPNMGAYAEYLRIPEKGIVALKPKNITFEEASAVSYGAIMALNMLKKANLKPGQKILINGASGGIGPMVVQITKYFGVEVTGVCSALKMDYVKSLGADKVIDYMKEDFTQNGNTYDYIIDILGKSSFAKCKQSLNPNGRCLLVSFKMKHIFQMLWTSIMDNRKIICVLSTETKEDLVVVKKLIEEGIIKPVIDKCFPLEKAADAHRYAESGSKKGNIVITVNK